jgi:hypothetical protein
MQSKLRFIALCLGVIGIGLFNSTNVRAESDYLVEDYSKNVVPHMLFAKTIEGPGAVTSIKAARKTIYYLPYANFAIRYEGMSRQNYKQVIFLGTVKTADCDERGRYSFKNQIAFQFTQHIEAYYKSKLGVWHSWRERIGYWRFADRGNELYGLRARIAKRYPLVEYINDFTFRCK